MYMLTFRRDSLKIVRLINTPQQKNTSCNTWGARVPDLERSKGDNRGSLSMHLSSGETLDFALASPQIMEELVRNVKDDPPWLCWLAHVRQLRFVQRRAYDLARDIPECHRLQAEFLRAFRLVVQWKEGYVKPKLHLGEHFGEVLGELGPFRNYNCLWGEAYIQILKAMFRSTNWKSAPYDVAVHWATKSVMHYRNPSRGAWYEDTVTPSTEFYFDLKALQSPLADAVVVTDPSVLSLRFVSEFRRGPDAVRLNDWIIVDKNDVPSMSARVDSIVQITCADTSASYVRVWCAQSRAIHVDDAYNEWSARSVKAVSMVVKLETTQVRVVACTVEQSRYVFN